MSINATTDPRWEEPRRREALHQKGRETKGKLWKTRGRTCLPPMRYGCCYPESAGCHSQVWMKSLVGSLASLCFPLTPAASLFIELPQTIPKQLHAALWQALPFVLNMCETTGKAYACFVPPPRKRNTYPFAMHVRFGISRSSLRERFQAGEFCKGGEDAFHKGDARTLKQESVPIQNKRPCDNVFMCFL